MNGVKISWAKPTPSDPRGQAWESCPGPLLPFSLLLPMPRSERERTGLMSHKALHGSAIHFSQMGGRAGDTSAEELTGLIWPSTC